MSILGTIKRVLRRRELVFKDSAQYWRDRYTSGGDSGAGSYRNLARFKAEIVNKFVHELSICSIIEFGCGDGNQLKLADYPSYIGFDISPDVVSRCRKDFRRDSTKSFRLVEDYRHEKADLTLSLDVIYHLVEDEVFEKYMEMLFDAAERFVVIYSSDTEGNGGDAPHVRPRKFTRWINAKRPEWCLVRYIPNRYPFQGDVKHGSFADFFIYARGNNIGERT
jgi:hypothetical protein